MSRALKTPWRGLGLALAGVLALPLGTAFAIDHPMANNPIPDNGTTQLLARGGGGGGSRGGGGSARRAGGNSGFRAMPVLASTAAQAGPPVAGATMPGLVRELAGQVGLP